MSEAEAMREHLVEHGIPQGQIVLEDRSTTTWENLANSKALIDAREAASVRPSSPATTTSITA